MTLQFELTAQDYMDLNFYYSWSSPDKSENRIVKSFIPLIIFVLIILSEKGLNFEQYGTAEVLLLSFGLIVGVLMGRLVKWNIKRLVRNLINSGKNTNLLGMKTLHFEEDMLIEHNETSKSEILWTAFEKFRETKDHFFLFIHVNQAIIVPKRVLSLPTEVDSFRNFISGKIQ